MAAAELIAAGTGAANSSDQTIAAGSSLVVALKSATASAEVVISLKDDASAYQPVDVLSNSKKAVCIVGPGVYRITRTANSGSCGVFSG